MKALRDIDWAKVAKCPNIRTAADHYNIHSACLLGFAMRAIGNRRSFPNPNEAAQLLRLPLPVTQKILYMNDKGDFHRAAELLIAAFARKPA